MQAVLKYLSCVVFLLAIAAQIRASETSPPWLQDELEEQKNPWPFRWFPHPPHQTDGDDEGWEPWSAEDFEDHPPPLHPNCDDGVTSIAIDFDPKVQSDNQKYLCIGDRRKYKPNLNRNPVLVEHFVPPAYVAPMKCLNETIEYDQRPPTFGAFRPLSSNYGEYLYMPPQRWIRSLAEGAIVMLYHPCANLNQISLLKSAVSRCLYRHIITPSSDLTPEYPLALISWGKMLKMSAVPPDIVVDFIKANALKGPISHVNLGVRTESYAAGLKKEAKIVTNINDATLCSFR